MAKKSTQKLSVSAKKTSGEKSGIRPFFLVLFSAGLLILAYTLYHQKNNNGQLPEMFGYETLCTPKRCLQKYNHCKENCKTGENLDREACRACCNDRYKKRPGDLCENHSCSFKASWYPWNSNCWSKRTGN